MNEYGFQFRTAAFGGFQKQDVMDYLERSAKEHAEKLAALQRELAEERSARQAEQDHVEETEDRLALLTAENQRLAVDLAERETTLAETAQELAGLKALAAELQEKVEKLAPAAAAYETVKDRTASIELEAHGRAQAIEQEGRSKARKCQEQVKEWFAKTQEAYVRLREDMDAAVEKAARELGEATQTVEALSGSLDGQSDALAAIAAQIEALDGVKPPQPLSLEDADR